jgi:hypothetical protein
LRSVAVQVLSEPENCQDTGFKLRAGARVRVQVSAGIVMGAGSRKNHDKQLTHIVRVRFRFYCFFFIAIRVVVLMKFDLLSVYFSLSFLNCVASFLFSFP